MFAAEASFISRYFRRYSLSLVRKSGFAEKAVIWGDGQLGKSIEDVIKRSHVPGICLADSIKSANPRERSFEEVVSICNGYNARVLIYDKDRKLSASLRKRFRRYGIEAFQAADFYQLITGTFPGPEVSDRTFDECFLVNDTILPELMSRLFGLFALLITLPLYLLIMIGIRLNSRGSVFFVQRRLGRGGKPFSFIKFRTMAENPDRQNVETNWMNTAVPEAENPDITSFGRILRKYKLDEIPQFINLIKGDINLVGPRPERPKASQERVKLVPFYEKRLGVKPGITGWAQVHPFRSASAKLEYDLFYIKHRCLLLDIFIVLRTVWVMLRGKSD